LFWLNKNMLASRRSIKEELTSHFDDLVFELMAEGVSRSEAEKQASIEFGDFEKHLKETIAVSGALPWSLAKIFNGVYLLSGLTLIILAVGFPSLIAGTHVETALLWWVFSCYLLLGLIGERWLIEYRGIDSKHSVWLAMTWTHLIALAATVILDIDKFENNVHAIVFSLLVLTPVLLLWNKLDTKIRRLVIYLQTTVVLWSIFTDTLIFNFLMPARCFFVTPDNVPLNGVLSSCTQVQLSNPALYPIYAVVMLGLPLIAVTLYKYSRNQGSFRYRKACLPLLSVLVIFVPWFINDINNEAMLDVISAKPKIFAIYQSSLGRDPEDKDIRFYAKTRAYTNLDKIEETLNASDERKQVIQKIYLNKTGRVATNEEIEAAVDSKISVQELRASLAQ